MTDQSTNPVILSWSSELQTEVTNPHVYSSSESGSPAVPQEDPPGYAASHMPTVPLKYTFSKLGFNSMLLVPPPTAPDTRPQYYISTSLNVFMPLCYVTSIYRGPNENGELVGEFEMGIINTPAKVKTKTMNCAINHVLRLARKTFKGDHWEWSSTGSHRDFKLLWFCKKDQSGYQCTILGPDTREVLLAKFSHPAKENPQLYTQSKLEVTVAGYDYFDDILISVLILERKRLTPTDIDHKVMFN